MTPRTAKSRCIAFLVLLGLYALPGLTGAQPPEPYRVRADNMELREIDGEKVLELRDNVRILHNDVTVTADYGRSYSDRGVTLLTGSVKIVQGTMTMWGDAGEYSKPTDTAVLRRNVRIVDEGWEVTCNVARYSRSTGVAWLIGDVVARDSTSTLFADSLLYNRNNEQTEAFGNVEMTNEDEGFLVTGEHGYYFRADGQGVVDRNPRLMVDPDSDEPVTVVSDTMRVFPDSSHALAYYRVKIIKGNTVTQCDSAVVYDGRNVAELYGNPLARQDRVSMSASKMFLHYNDDEVFRIDLEGGAKIREQQPDTMVVGRDSWIEGDAVTLHLDDNRVDSIRVRNNAVSEYYPRSSPRRVESNFARGDGMFFRFEGDSLKYVRITGDASGVYRYLDLKTAQTTDSLRALADTSLTFRPFREDAQKVVYSGREIQYFADRGDLVLDESATIVYRRSSLAGEEINYYSELELLDATGEPVLTEGGEKFYGERMNYDMATEAGLVTEGSTKFGEGYYTGEHVAKVGENTMKVWRSIYTTCDLAVPHYHFKAKEMKVYTDDKVITGPIWLYIGETPIAFLPFMAANLKRDRRSGILRPEFEFGFDRSSGRYLRGMGYYWATNDYTDFTFRGDFNEDSSFRIFVENRYKVRYMFDGNVNYSFFRDLSTYGNKWTLDARHRQTFGDGYSFNSDLHFISDDTAPRSISRIDDVDRVIDREIRSNMSLSKRWKKIGFSASANRTQRLDITDPNRAQIDLTLPSVTLSIQPINLFPAGGNERNPGLFRRLFGDARLSPSLSGSRRVVEKLFRYEETISSRQGVGLSASPKFGFLTVSPRLSATNTTTRTSFEEYSHTEEQISGGDTTTTVVPYSLDVDTENQFSWNMGANTSANIYGTFYPRIGRLRGVRHTISPSVSYTYTPDVGNRGPRSQRFSVSLRQSLDLKVLSGRQPGAAAAQGTTPGAATSDEAAGQPEEEKVQKLNGVAIWNLSSSYNPEAPADRGWSNVSSTVNTRLLGTNVSLNQTVDPYELEVLSTSVTTGLRVSGSHPFGRSSQVTVRELNIVAAADTTDGGQKSSGGSVSQTGDTIDRGAGQDRLGLEEGYLPWSASVDLSYTKRRDSDARSTLRFNGNMDLTETWSVAYSATYDVDGRILSGQNYRITRNLHCWEMSFSRQKLGQEWQFYFKIALKAHPEVYAEQGRRGLGGGTFGTSSFGF